MNYDFLIPPSFFLSNKLGFNEGRALREDHLYGNGK